MTAKLTIKNDTGFPQDTIVLLDGQEIPGFSAISLGVSIDDILTEAHIIVQVEEIDVELSGEMTVREQIVTLSPPVGISRCSECGCYKIEDE